jgi:hypothetical protein
MYHFLVGLAKNIVAQLRHEWQLFRCPEIGPLFAPFCRSDFGPVDLSDSGNLSVDGE